METRIGGERAKEITDCLPVDGATYAETIGYAGGLWLLWDSDRVEESLLAKTEQEIHVTVKVRSPDLCWLFSAIYTSPRLAERRVLWNNLSDLSELHNLPWVYAGDFNEPLTDNDKLGGRPVNISRSLEFKDCLDRCNLLDLVFFFFLSKVHLEK